MNKPNKIIKYQMIRKIIRENDTELNIGRENLLQIFFYIG